jgi:hypothetical protein
MRKTLLAALVALVVTSAAVAAPEKGKPPVTGAGCKPSVAVIVTGTLAADGTASSLSVNVTGGNHAAQVYKQAPQPISIVVTSSTKISRQGHHLATDLKNHDRVNIQAKACKADLANTTATPPALTATRVTAHPASS